MLQEIYLVNSAQFRFAHVDLRRDLFFLGDNGSGKTSFIRAIHFLYSGDTRSVGIPADKTAFADYYFPYENSYIVYVFSRFFILMTRRGGEIVKYFSLQPFSMNKITDEKGELLPFETIRRVVRSVVHKRVTGVREYTEILYGQNRKYLDFALARIGNHGPFLRLYNAIFNIDRAMIDAKSLKQALFTALELDEESAFFDPEEYLSKVNEFAQYSRLFHDFERERERIERLVALKPELLKAEEALRRLSRQINYRQKEERRLLEEAEERMAKLGSRLEAARGRIVFFEKVDERLRKRCNAAENEVSYALGEIAKLKALYTPERLAAWRKKAGAWQEIVLKKREAERERALLSAGVLDQAESVARQIASLEREKSEGLALRFARRLAEERQTLEEGLAADLAALEAEWERKEARYEERSEKLERRLEAEGARLEAIDADLAALAARKAALREEGSVARASAARERDEELEATTKRRLALMEEREALGRRRREETTRFEARRQKAEADYRREEDEISRERERLEGVLRSEPGTFRAFLDDEVEGWRQRLYPVLEKSLLAMPADALSPRYLGEPLLGIALDTSGLPAMPTTEEAQRALEALEARAKALRESFEAARERSTAEEADALARIEGEITLIERRIVREEEAAAEVRKNYEEHLAAIERDLREGEKRLAAEAAGLEEKRRQVQERIVSIRSETESLKKRRNGERSAWKRRREERKAALKKASQQLRKRLEAEQAEKAARLEEEIARLNEKKAQIEGDTRLKELSEHIAALEEAEQKALEAQLRLQSYETDREKLAKEPELLSRKARIATTRRRLKARRVERYRALAAARETLEREIAEAKGQIALIEKGLAREAPEPVDSGEEPTDLYLDELKMHYEEATVSYERRLLKLQELMRRVNAIEGLHRLDQLHFDLGLFEQARFLGEIEPLLAAIDRLEEVQKSSIDTVKRGQQLKFRNFVENLYTKKLELFSSGEARFAELVRRINKELKAVDFGVIREIRIETRIGSGESVAAMLEKLREKMADIGSLFTGDSLFFDRRDALKHLEEMEGLFVRIKKALGGDRISLVDTVDLGLSFTENDKRYENRSRIKNESSTGGSMLLKIALAVSILRVYLKEAEGGFFLIVDEVARLHSGNQRRLKAFANASGFRIIFVTPEPVFADPEALGYYRFEKREERSFEVIALNR